MPRLDQLQRWFLEAVTGSAAAGEIDEHVRASAQQTAGERLGVYQSAYTARLIEVLQNFFPCTRNAVGDELFAQFAAGYIQAHPPTSYTLGRLADHFADYLEATRPIDWGAFVVELVRMEQAIERVFDGAGPENLPPFSLPEETDASVMLRLIPSFELHRFSYPASDYFTDWKAGRQMEWPQPREQFVALFRREYVVRRHNLSAEQHAVLTAIQGGASLGEALIAAAEHSENDVDSLARQFREWFAVWAAERFFA